MCTLYGMYFLLRDESIYRVCGSANKLPKALFGRQVACNDGAAFM
jgi:hypothetical protein